MHHCRQPVISGSPASQSGSTQAVLSEPSLQPSYIQAHPTKAQVAGLLASRQIGQQALSASRLKLLRPCMHHSAILRL